MSSWQCQVCRTVYAPGVLACPHCEGGAVAHASREGGSTHFMPEGQTVPSDLPADVRLVGPGAPEPEPEAEELPEAEVEPEPATGAYTTASSAVPASEPEPSAGDEPADWNAHPVRVLRDVARERDLSVAGAKADLVARLAAHDAEHDH